MSLTFSFGWGAILAEILAFEGAMKPGPLARLGAALDWPARQHHDIVIVSRQIPDATDWFVFFFGPQPYELDDLGGGTGRVAFSRFRGSLRVRPSRHPGEAPDDAGDLIPA